MLNTIEREREGERERERERERESGGRRRQKQMEQKNKWTRQTCVADIVWEDNVLATALSTIYDVAYINYTKLIYIHYIKL